MDVDDFAGGTAGAAGGLVRLVQSPLAPTGRPLSFWTRVKVGAAGGVCGYGFGYLTQAVVEWQLPSVPRTVAIGLGFVAGLASGILAQTVILLAADLSARARRRVLARFPESPDGSSPDPGGTAARPPALAVAGVHRHDGDSLDPVAGGELPQPGGAGGTTPPPG